MKNRLSKSTQLKIEYRNPGSLTPYANNARKHPKAQIKQIAASIKAFGWVNPLIIDCDGGVLCGHGRLEAALLLGCTQVPTITLEQLSDADRRAYIIADNAIAEKSGWTTSTLSSELSGLAAIGYELELTGLDEIKIEALLSFGNEDDGLNDDDVELPDEEPVPVSRLGDVWQIGSHRLVVGDARDPAAYDQLLGNERVQMIITDPPYGCRIQGNVSGGGQKVHDDFLEGAGQTSLLEFGQTLIRPAMRAMAARCCPGAIAFVFTDWRAAPYMLDAAAGVFHEVKQLVVWVKSNGGQGSFYRSAHELVHVFKVSQGDHINNFGLGGRYRTNVWSYPGANVFRKGRMQDLNDHPTVKNKKMVADAILDCSKRGGVVLDPFLGSGTLLCAAEKTGRLGRGMELDPKYADVAIRRTERATGKVATLSGVSFAEVATARAKREEDKRGAA